MADDNNGSSNSTATANSFAKSPHAIQSADDHPPEPQSSTSSTIAAVEASLDSFSINEPDGSNVQAVTAGDTPYTSALTFEDLNISPDLLKGLYIEMKFERPSKIQSISLPMILEPPFKNLIAQAHNGSGKTTCFVLGMLSRVDPKLSAPQALCICPTRELAIQNMEVLMKMGKFTGITSELGCEAQNNVNHIAISKRAPVTAQVVIGTPGTINKWITASKLSTAYLKVLVFDEADHMLAEAGFKDCSVRIMKKIVNWSPNCQVLLFSATFNETVKAFVLKIVKDLFVKEYNQLYVKKEDLCLDSVKQYKLKLPDELSKIMVIREKILEIAEKVGQTIIFVRTRKSAGMLHEALTAPGFKYAVTTIQGALTQQARDEIIKEFKTNYTGVLISTDLLARGFDQSQVNLVINYDLPIRHDCPSEPDYEVYLHRIGRAGRFGRKGAVFNLLCGEMDYMIMEKIEKHFNHYVAEVPSWTSYDDINEALKKARLA